MSINRRRLLHLAALTSGSLATQGLVAHAQRLTQGRPIHATRPGSGSYGPLRSRLANNSNQTILALPRGFQYTILGRAGEQMSDQRPTPKSHDGMATFQVQGELRLVRNHEILTRTGQPGIALAKPDDSYDPLAGGGTTTLIIDPKSRRLVRDFVSLSGTLFNCAGGPTPWGSWISCEETVLGQRRIQSSNGQFAGGFSQNHGYCFEVSAAANGPVATPPLRGMGRFVHEAIAIDATTSIVYETEDAKPEAGFYRYIPNIKGQLAQGGKLQMLAIEGRPRYDTRTGQRVGVKLPVTWVDIADPDPTQADQNQMLVYQQGHDKGGATFIRLEGCWAGEGRIVFTSTSGGDRRLGQVWEYRPQGNGGGTLTLLAEPQSTAGLRAPDNLCISPRGGLVICEDNGQANHLWGLTPQGLMFQLAKNVMPGYETMEFAGATFSPDGQTLFVNLQTPGLTLAIWGPWEQGAL